MITSQYLSEFATIVLVHFLAVASPGPDFAVIIRQSLIYGKKTGCVSSVGVGCGILVHVLYSLLGIGLIVSSSVMVFSLMKFLGALYLIYLGVKGIRCRPLAGGVIEEQAAQPPPSPLKAFWVGFFTNGLNPKATLFFLSLFTVVISPDTPLLIQAGYGVYMAFATAVWFCSVSFLFGSSRVRSAFKRMGHWLERLTGAVLIGLGVKLAVSVQEKGLPL